MSTRAFVKYDAAGRLISGVLRTGDGPPTGRGWVEVPASLCCSTISVPKPHSIFPVLRGYIRYDKQGLVVSGSTVVRKKIPSDGKWKPIPYNRCC